MSPIFEIVGIAMEALGQCAVAEGNRFGFATAQQGNELVAPLFVDRVVGKESMELVVDRAQKKDHLNFLRSAQGQQSF